jgi:hypothetical protein
VKPERYARSRANISPIFSIERYHAATKASVNTAENFIKTLSEEQFKSILGNLSNKERRAVKAIRRQK